MSVSPTLTRPLTRPPGCHPSPPRSRRAQYADNILKTFATVLAIVCSCFISMSIAEFDFKPSPVFFVGVGVVFSSIFLYSWTPQQPLSHYFFRRDYSV